MGSNDNFDSLFESDLTENDTTTSNQKIENDEDFSLDDFMEDEPSLKVEINPTISIEKKSTKNTNKRSSKDFQPDMDALLITAQSPMIIEGIKRISLKKYSFKDLQTYVEAIKGLELFIKILERNPENYYKLHSLIQSDEDCKEVEQVAFSIYSKSHKEPPNSDAQKIQSFQMLMDRLKTGYFKAAISNSFIQVKKYFLMSGGINTDLVISKIKSNENEIEKEIKKFKEHLKVAIHLIKKGQAEIAPGMKGKDTNIFITYVSQILQFYYQHIGDLKSAEYFQKIYTTYSKYFIMR